MSRPFKTIKYSRFHFYLVRKDGTETLSGTRGGLAEAARYYKTLSDHVKSKYWLPEEQRTTIRVEQFRVTEVGSDATSYFQKGEES